MAGRGKPVRVPTSLKAQATVRPTSADSGFQRLGSPRGGLLTATDSNAGRLTPLNCLSSLPGVVVTLVTLPRPGALDAGGLGDALVGGGGLAAIQWA